MVRIKCISSRGGGYTLVRLVYDSDRLPRLLDSPYSLERSVYRSLLTSKHRLLCFASIHASFSI